jgi:6-pyruvoyltetrahydropterin/6-carboxytetrahydropterin synthase
VWTIIIEVQFKASHSVAMRDGSMEPQHEHFWAVTVEAGTGKLDEKGMAIDFAQFKARLNNITSQLSGATLNDVEYFHDKCATAERVAEYVFNTLEPNLPEGVHLESVTVSEQVGCSARYRK